MSDSPFTGYLQVVPWGVVPSRFPYRHLQSCAPTQIRFHGAMRAGHGMRVWRKSTYEHQIINRRVLRCCRQTRLRLRGNQCAGSGDSDYGQGCGEAAQLLAGSFARLLRELRLAVRSRSGVPDKDCSGRGVTTATGRVSKKRALASFVFLACSSARRNTMFGRNSLRVSRMSLVRSHPVTVWASVSILSTSNGARNAIILSSSFLGFSTLYCMEDLVYRHQK